MSFSNGLQVSDLEIQVVMVGKINISDKFHSQSDFQCREDLSIIILITNGFISWIKAVFIYGGVPMEGGLSSRFISGGAVFSRSNQQQSHKTFDLIDQCTCVNK